MLDVFQSIEGIKKLSIEHFHYIRSFALQTVTILIVEYVYLVEGAAVKFMSKNKIKKEQKKTSQSVHYPNLNGIILKVMVNPTNFKYCIIVLQSLVWEYNLDSQISLLFW